MKTNQDEVSCRVCRKPLPIPQMKKSGKVRLIKGFRTSYRRMWWDRPGGTLTMNSGVPLGKWDESQSFSTRLVREVIGESIPPLAMKCMVDHLLRLETSTE